MGDFLVSLFLIGQTPGGAGGVKPQLICPASAGYFFSDLLEPEDPGQNQKIYWI